MSATASESSNNRILLGDSTDQQVEKLPRPPTILLDVPRGGTLFQGGTNVME